MSYFEKHQEFVKWTDNLEERLALWLFEHPEKEQAEQKLLVVGSLPPIIDLEAFRRQGATPPRSCFPRVEVRENEDDSTWEVYVNGDMKYSFAGVMAQQMATKRAGEILDGY